MYGGISHKSKIKAWYTMSSVLIILILVITSVAGCTQGAVTDTKVYNLTFASQHAITSQDNLICEAFAKWLEAESNGRLKITTKPASVLAQAADMYDAARTGIADISDQFIGFIPGRFPLLELSYLPFLFKDPDNIRAQQVMTELYNKFPEFQTEHKDVKLLGIWVTGQNTWNAKEPIHTIDDLKGQIMIVSGAVKSKTLQLLGAEPAQVAFAEQYDAIAKGVVDGIDTNSQGHVQNTKTYELCNYSTLVCSACGVWIQAMNLDTWNSLPADLQELLEDSFERLSLARTVEWYRSCHENQTWLDNYLKQKGYEGVYVLPETEREKMLEIVKSQWEEWVQELAPDIGEAKAREILAAVQNMNEEVDVSEALQKQSFDWLDEIGYIAP